MPIATVVSTELQLVDGGSNKRYVGHAVTIGDRAWPVYQFGPRGKTCQFKIDDEVDPWSVQDYAEDHAGEKIYRGYHYVDRRTTFTAELPILKPGKGKDIPGFDALATAYEQARRDSHRHVLDLIAKAAAGHAPGDRYWLLALERFALESKSEPVAQSLADVMDAVSAHVGANGTAAFALPISAAAAVREVYQPRCVTTSVDVDRDIRPEVLQTLLTLWDPDASGDLSSLDTAYTTAVLLAD